ncbi:hypothetical protein BAU67_001793 [Escherichia coli]|nr:hypothetical protein [Escherichia coli]EMB7054237.1 hypothetical protein [Escherichia coli]
MVENSKWKDLGFASRSEYVGWLWFNGLTNDIKMYDDVYYDEYSGKVINISVDDNESVSSEDCDKISFEEYGINVEESN